MKFKKFSLLLAVLICLTAIGGCASSGTASDTTTQAPVAILPEQEEVITVEDRIIRTFPEYVQQCTHIVDAECIGFENDQMEGLQVIFKVKKTYKGDTEENELLYVFPFADTAAANKAPYKTGEQYMLFLKKRISVYRKHDHYSQIGYIYMPETDEAWERTHKETVTLLKDSKYSAEVQPLGNAFTTSSAVADAVELAEYIFVVRVDSLDFASDIQPTTSCKCSVTKTIRNTPNNHGNIDVVFFNDTVEIGKEYVVLLMGRDTSSVYTLASKNSVFTLEEASMQAALAPLLGTKLDYEAGEWKEFTDAEMLEAEMKANAEELEKNPELKAQLEAELERLKEAEKTGN